MTGKKLLAGVGEKYCSKCFTLKLISMFGKDRGRTDGLQTKCKQCHTKYVADNRDRISKYNSGYHIGNKSSISLRQQAYRQQIGLSITMHNISVEEYEEMLVMQNGHCADCSSTVGSRAGGRLEIDHDHKHCEKCVGTWACSRGSIRALVCSSCNKLRRSKDA